VVQTWVLPKKRRQRQYDDVKKLRQEQEARGCSFYDMISTFKNTLKHDDYTLMENIVTGMNISKNIFNECG